MTTTDAGAPAPRTTSSYDIQADRTARGSLLMAWPTDTDSDEALVCALTDALEESMSDRSLRRVVVTIAVTR